jgi:hypothetical protein
VSNHALADDVWRKSKTANNDAAGGYMHNGNQSNASFCQPMLMLCDK